MWSSEPAARSHLADDDRRLDQDAAGTGHFALGGNAQHHQSSTRFDGSISRRGLAGAAATGGNCFSPAQALTLSCTNTYTGTTTINPARTLHSPPGSLPPVLPKSSTTRLFRYLADILSRDDQTLSGNGAGLVVLKSWSSATARRRSQVTNATMRPRGGVSGTLGCASGVHTLSASTPIPASADPPLIYRQHRDNPLATTGTGSIATSARCSLRPPACTFALLATHRRRL